MKYTLYIGTNKYSLSTEDDILKLSPSNFECQHKILTGNKDFLKFFVNKTKNIIENKKKIDIRQLELFENYRENRI